MFVKIGDFIKFKGFSCGILTEQALLRKSKTPRKLPEKWTFLSLAFTMHLVCTLLIEASQLALTNPITSKPRNWPRQTLLLKHDLPFHGMSQECCQDSRAAKRGGFKRESFPIWTCPSFFVLFRPFWDFPDFFGIFPICPGTLRGFSRFVLLPLSRPINSAYEEQSRKGLRHNLDLSRKKWETSRFGNPPGLASPKGCPRPLEVFKSLYTKGVIEGRVLRNLFNGSDSYKGS